MRRLKVSEEKHEQILKLRQTGASWLRIQRETGVPRRSAKKVYEAWTKNQAREELKEARKQVVAEQFSKHLKELVMTAKMLADYLPDELAFNETRSSIEIIDNIWTIDPSSKDNVEEEKLPYDTMLAVKERRRIVRQNKLLFDSLKEHTRDKLNWQMLDEWRNEWDRVIEIQSQIRTNTKQLVLMILDGQRKDIKQRISNEAKKGIILRDIIDGVCEAVWHSVQEETPKDAETFIQIHKFGKDKASLYSLYFGKEESITKLNFTDINLAQDVHKVCTQAAGSIGKSDIAERLLDIKRRLAEKTLELEVMLDAVRLRPLILRTRCDLCPA
jgi:hypothetical protein